jgi:hypothetical protein
MKQANKKQPSAQSAKKPAPKPRSSEPSKREVARQPVHPVKPKR